MISTIIIGIVLFIFFCIGLPWIFSGIKSLKEYERGVVFRLGRCIGVKGPGLFWIFPGLDKLFRVQLRTVTYDARRIHVITQDNVRCDVDSVVYYKVVDPKKAVLEIDNFRVAVENIGKAVLRDVLGHADLDDLLGNTEALTVEVREELDKKTDSWGIKVTQVAVSDVILPQEMQRAIAKQAEAERERRARSIVADGEFEAAQKMMDAAKIYAQSPLSLKLRELQTYAEIAREKNLVIISNTSETSDIGKAIAAAKGVR